MNTKLLALMLGGLLLSAAGGRYLALNDPVGAGIAFIAALLATFAAIRAAMQ